jgi:uncharacterized membrane protein YeaQ/YmgE (transglycosylase-associated protein family)
MCNPFGCLWILIVGGTAGFLAGHVIRGRGYNPFINIALGMEGFFVGSLFLGDLGRSNICSAIGVSFVGALLLIAGMRLVVDKNFAR